MNIGLIAHDSKKILMQNFCIAYRGILCKHDIYATATTGRLVEEVTNLNIHKYLAGHLGGEKQLGAQIENNDPVGYQCCDSGAACEGLGTWRSGLARVGSPVMG